MLILYRYHQYGIIISIIIIININISIILLKAATQESYVVITTLYSKGDFTLRGFLPVQAS